MIVRETDRTDTWEAATPSAAIGTTPPDLRVVSSDSQQQTEPPDESEPRGDQPAGAPAEQDEELVDDSRVRLEILSHVRRLVRNSEIEEFSFLKLAGGIVQMLALLTLLISVIYVLGSQPRIPAATFWAVISVALQTMALTFFTIQRNK